jgi:hypothetical protein
VVGLTTSLPTPITYTISNAQISLAFPSYSTLPLGCVSNLQYAVSLTSKTAIPGLGDTSPFNAQLNGLPTFVNWDPLLGFTIQGSNF